MYRLGYLTLRNLTDWLSDEVGFRLNEYEAKLVLNRYDKDADYCISMAEFMEEVSAINMQQEEGNEEDPQIEDGDYREEQPEFKQNDDRGEENEDAYESDNGLHDREEMMQRYSGPEEGEALHSQEDEGHQPSQPDDDHRYLEGLGEEEAQEAEEPLIPINGKLYKIVN